MQALFQDDATRAALMYAYNWPTPEIFATLYDLKYQTIYAFLILLGLALAAHILRRAIRGLVCGVPAAGVPHTALCAGKGRRTAEQLPYDVIFILNRFFDAIVPAVTRAGSTIDKYLGDGFLAVFETPHA